MTLPITRAELAESWAVLGRGGVPRNLLGARLETKKIGGGGSKPRKHPTNLSTRRSQSLDPRNFRQVVECVGWNSGFLGNCRGNG
jgi:hypothetical protein